MLEGYNIKLGRVLTDINGESGMAILRTIISGEVDPIVLSELSKRKSRNKM